MDRTRLRFNPVAGCLRCLLAVGIVCGGLLTLSVLTSGFWLRQIGHWLEQPAQVEQADAIVVLAGNLRRLETAVQLYQAGLAPELWYTGDAPQGEPAFAEESKLARAAAIGLGVPAAAIRLLPTTSTWEDGEQTASAVRSHQARAVLVVTSWYHGRRGLCMVRHHLQDMDVAVYYQPASNEVHDADNWWQTEQGLMAVTGELLKFGHYWWRYGLSPWSC